MSDLRAVFAEIERMKSQRDRAVELLRKHGTAKHFPQPVCRECYGFAASHKPACPLAALLKEVE